MATAKMNSVLDFTTVAALRNAVGRNIQLRDEGSDISTANAMKVDTEVRRLQALRQTQVLRSGTDKGLDELTESLRVKLDVTWVAACFVDLNRVYVKSAAEKAGYPFGVSSGDDTPRRNSFASTIIESLKNAEVINDVLLDDRVKNGPWVEGHPKVRFFAGVPILSPNCKRLGCLCVLDNKPHPDGLKLSEELEIQKVATQISEAHLGASSTTPQRKRRPRSQSCSSGTEHDSLSPSFSSACGSPTPKRHGRSRSPSPVKIPTIIRAEPFYDEKDLPAPDAADICPDEYLSQLVSVMTGGKKLLIKPSMSFEDFFQVVSDEQTSRYCMKVVGMARNNDVEGLRDLYQTQGREALDCYNRFGEGLLTLACRRGFKDMVQLLLSREVNLSVRLRDDYGRTVVHDACWNPEPQLEICSWLLEREPCLFLLADKRGFSPFQYARQGDWLVWRQFLFDQRDHLLALATSDKAALFSE